MMKILCLFLLVSGAQATVGTITKLRLMDAVTNQPIAQFDPLTNNAVIDLVKLSSTSFTIEAVTNGRIGSIKFSSGTFVNIENAGRWAMCRNNGNDLFPCKSLVEGFDGTVTATPYSEDNAKGNMGTPFPITFKIIRSPCPNGAITYQPGKATVSQNGMILSAGLTSRLIAERGKQVLLSDGTYSKDVFHGLPDAAAIFEDPNSDSYKYVSNSELGNIPNSTLGIGGVGSITFDKYGNVTGFEILQNGTIRNCGGGKTWWNTWLTCEEYAGGQVYEIDPFKPPKTDRKTVLAQPYTSPWESAAYDNRDTNKPTFYVTADKSNGPLLRFTPAPSTVATAKATNDYSNLLHDNVTGTQWEYMVMKPDPTTNLTGTFTWTTNVTVSEISARNFYRSSEGLDIRNGILYMTTKRDRWLFILDLDKLTYTRSSTNSGAFDGQPDQIGRLLEDVDQDLLYFCEDVDDYAGVHARDATGKYYSILQGEKGALDGETSGIAFGPKNQIMYVSFQTEGLIFEITRNDGCTFSGTSLDIKYHNDASNENPFKLAP